MRITHVLAALVGVALAAPSPRSGHVLHEKRASEPVDWAVSRRLEPDKILPMRIGLAQRNLDRLEELLMEVSHPESPKYGQHYTPSEVVDTFAPTIETIEAVTNWLVNSGFSRDRLRLAGNKGWIHVNVTTAEAEELLDTQYHVYTHPSGDEQIGARFIIALQQYANILAGSLGCHSYSVPENVRQHVDLIKPTVHFNHRPSPKRMQKRAGGLGVPSFRTGPKKSSKEVTITPTLETCDSMITLDCLRALYSVNYTPVATAKNSFGIGNLIVS